MGKLVGGFALSVFNFGVLYALWRPPLIEHGVGAIILAVVVLMLALVEATSAGPSITWFAWIATLAAFSAYVMATTDADGWEEALGTTVFLGGFAIISIVCGISTASARRERSW